MVVLRALVVATLLAGCYEPDLQDCTITCSEGDSCGDGQTCSGGFCVREGATCSGGMAMPVPTAKPDGPPPPPMTQVTVAADGPGSIEVMGQTACDGSCTFSVLRGTALVVTARPKPDKHFEQWTTPACTNQPEICHVTASDAALTIGAKFK